MITARARNWLDGHCFGSGPSSFESVAQEVRLNAEFTSPITQDHRATCMSDPPVIGLVVILVSPCAPLAIARLVMAVIVEPLKCVLRGWTPTHVSDKALELKPTFTDLYPAPSVSAEVRVIAFKAPSLHRAPHLVLRRGVQAVRAHSAYAERVNALRLRAIKFFFDAAARLCLAALETSQRSGDGVAANARAGHKPASKLVRASVCAHGESAKNQSNNRWFHAGNCTALAVEEQSYDV